MGGRVRWVSAAAGALLLGLAASGCGAGGDDGAADPQTTAPQAAPAGQEALARFYTQKLSWGTCEGGDGSDPKGTTCAWITVPIDYTRPDGPTTRLRMLKVPAQGGRSPGSLFVNPGGPGGSAVDYARMADYVVSPQVRRNDDIVGVDPRGVGHSDPIDCVDAGAVDTMIGLDPTPDDPQEMNALEQSGEALGQACEKKYPQILGHVSTVDAARDMDVARAVLGRAKLDYLGKSYGTFLGATYAGLFPKNVGHVVLDGAIAPDLTNDEMNLGQAQGFETATRAYMAYCVSEGNCPFGGDVESGMANLRQFLEDLDAHPIPVKGDPRVTQLTEGWAGTGLARGMYEQSLWDGLTDAVRQAKAGDGSDLFAMAEEYADRSEKGTYNSNLMQVISAINCADRGSTPRTWPQMQGLSAEFAKSAPTWGPSMVWGSTTCDHWPVKGPERPPKITASGSGPILVVGTTRDPATPYPWAQRLAGQLENGHLLTYDGDGHTAYMRSNDCVENAVDAYLLKGTTPADGAKC